MVLFSFNTLSIQNFQIHEKSALESLEGKKIENLLKTLTFFLYLKSDFNHPLGKESILVWNPVFIGQLDELEWTEFSPQDPFKIEKYPQTVFQTRIPDLLNEIKDKFHPNHTENSFEFESYLGLYGYTAYETGRLLDPHSHRNDHAQYPLAIYFLPRCYMIETQTHWISFELDIRGFVEQPLLSLKPSNCDFTAYSDIPLNYSSYIQTIHQIQDYIRKGDIYQANYTIPFTLPPSSIPGDQIFSDLFTKNPTPYAVLFRWGVFEIISLSMELFLQIKQGKVVTCPIKGTAPRGTTETEDKQNKLELRNSTKDHAELAMIVDLLRNDLSRSAHIGSVKVLHHAKLETFSNVHHLISTILGTIDPTPAASWGLYLRSFPGGSITGCPKLRSMEIIEELEKEPREIYTGSIGYLAIDGTLNKNIAIRTIIKTPDQIHFNAGGGITIYSQPELEFFEVYHKIRHFLAYFHGKQFGSIAFLDGKYVPMSIIPMFEKDNSKNLTKGCFETILIQNQQPVHLDRHVFRLTESLKYFETSLKENLSQFIDILLRLNSTKDARLRIRCVIDPNKSDTKYHLIMELFEITETIEPIQLICESIAITSEFPPQEVIQAGIKTLNYGSYRKATGEAQLHGAWDKVFVDRDGIFLECGRATIYFYLNNHWITPKKNVINGTVRQWLLSNKLVETGEITLKDIFKVKGIAVSNAIIGLKIVNTLIREERVIWEASYEAKKLFKDLFQHLNF